MDAEYFWIECTGCRLTWKLSLMECAVGRSLACPFCGSQHFATQTASPSGVEAHLERDGKGSARKHDKEGQFSWV